MRTLKPSLPASVFSGGTIPFSTFFPENSEPATLGLESVSQFFFLFLIFEPGEPEEGELHTASSQPPGKQTQKFIRISMSIQIFTH